MKRTVFIAGCAIALAGSSQALVPQASEPAPIEFVEFQMVGDLAGWTLPAINSLARRGADDGPGDDRRGRGRGTDDPAGHTWLAVPDAMEMAKNGADDGPGDDHGGHGGDDDGDDNGSGSGRDKPRIPGGSGCDDAGDVAEHPECSG